MVQEDAFNIHGDDKFEDKDDYSYIDNLLNDRSIQNQRMFDFYNLMDNKRTLKWKTMNPQLAYE